MISALQYTMGSLYLEEKNKDDALHSFDEFIDARKQRFGQDHPEIAESLHSVALILLHHSYPDDALCYFKSVVDLRREILAKDDDEDVGELIFKFGSKCVKEYQDQESSLHCFEEVLCLIRILSPYHHLPQPSSFSGATSVSIPFRGQPRNHYGLACLPLRDAESKKRTYKLLLRRFCPCSSQIPF